MLKSKTDSRLYWLILGILVIGSVYLVYQEFSISLKELNSLPQIETATIERLRQVAKEKVLYQIDFGEGTSKTYRLTPSEDSTVFSLLQELAQKENFQIEWSFYQGMGILVESIAGVENGADNKYWQYWVNGELPMVAADKKEVKIGDKVEWRFVPSPF